MILLRWLYIRFAPWRLLHATYRRFDWCWADLMSVRRYRETYREFRDERGGDVPVQEICFDAHPNQYDYCGSYGTDHPVCRRLIERRCAKLQGGQ